MTRDLPPVTATDEEIRAALEYANIPTLLAVLAYVTGDHAWLEDPYRPTRTVALDDNETGGFSPEIQTDIRTAAADLMHRWRAGEVPMPAPPTDEQIAEMLSVCMGEQVPPEYGPMMAEEAGFRHRDVTWTDGPPTERLAKFQVVVIGAGISGICTAIKLRELGIPYVVLEKNAKIGGTWLENDYPGAGVDTPSHLYSYSFDPSPTWSRYFAKQEEILAYIDRTAERHHILGNIDFRTEVIEATFDVAKQRWIISTRDADGTSKVYEADVVISSVGQLNRPMYPSIPGLDTFAGPEFHSARWRHDVELKGKRVGVLGTGASAMQIVPAIAGIPEKVVVFQRSPQWAAPNSNYLRPIESGTRLLMQQVPYYSTWYRMRLLWMFNDKLHPSLQIDPDWPHPARSINAANDKHRAFFTEHIREQLGDRQDMWDKVLPTYPPYGKRILLDNRWYPTILRDDVELVTSKVERVDANSVITADGEHHELDVLVLATGFQTQRVLWPMDFYGAGGHSLRSLWGDDDARAYLGLTVPDFPNLFVLFGPNTNLGHGGSVIFHTECQVNYVTRMLVMMIEGGVSSVSVKQEVFQDYNVRVDAALNKMIWTHQGMDTWYRNARGRVVTNTPWRLLDYWRMTRRPDLAEYLVTLAK